MGNAPDSGASVYRGHARKRPDDSSVRCDQAVRMNESPRALRTAVTLWAIAVAAGVVETLLVVVPVLTAGETDAGLWLNVGLRGVVYLAASLLVISFARGRRWSRIALTGLLGIVGLASMVVPAAQEITAGQTFLQAFGGDGSLAVAFLVVRLTHIASVIVATALMFTPSVNGYLARKPTMNPA